MRISRLNTQVPGGSGDTPLSCSGSNRPPRRGAYFFPLLKLRASPLDLGIHRAGPGSGRAKKSPVFFLAARARPDPVAGP